LFARAWWQRRGVAKQLSAEIRQHTQALDHVLGGLGEAARGARIEGRVFSAENAAISNAEDRIRQLGDERFDVESRKSEEHSKFDDVEKERIAKLTEAERVVDEVARELAALEGQRRDLRDRRKDLERHRKASQKAGEPLPDRNPLTASGDATGRTPEETRSAIDNPGSAGVRSTPDSGVRRSIDRQLGALERPIVEIAARLDASKAELDAAKRSLHDAREGHSHRLAELDAEHKRKSREIAMSQGEIARRLVTLGTLVNLNRIADAQFGALYRHIDLLRSAITVRTAHVEKLTSEREAYDKGALVRGIATIAGAALALTAAIVIALAIL
jgi:chromosome segregation ATPase